MKAWLVYWIAGCAVIGLATGTMMQRCPRDELPMSETVMGVAVWPAFFFAMFSGGKPEKSVCKIQ